LNKHLAKELEVQQLRNKIQTEVQDAVQQSQREYYLREQMKAISKELGDGDETSKDITELKEKIEAAGMPEDTKKEALKELQRLQRMSPNAADYGMTRSYIEWLAVLPWAKSSGVEADIPAAEQVPQRGPLRPAEGEGPHSGLPLCTPVEAGYEGANPLLRRTSGCG